MGRSRDIAKFLSATEVENTDNLNLLHTGSNVGVDSAQAQRIGLQTYSTLDSLPMTDLEQGEQAFITGTNRLYISNGAGWYNVALVNQSPQWASGGEPAAEYEIVDSATPLIITARAIDSDNSNINLFNQSFVTDSAQYMVDISNDSSVFTFTPKSADSIGQEVAAGNLSDSNGDFVYTFKWSDGINFVSKAATISYNVVTTAGPIFRGATQGVFTSSGPTEDITLAMPAGTEEGDYAIVVIGGLGWGLSSHASINNGNFGSPTNYQWGYQSGQTGYMTDLYADPSISSSLLSSGVSVRNNVSGTEYKLATLLTFANTTPIHAHTMINYGSQSSGSYYQQQSGTRPSGYTSLSGGGIVEVHTTREGNRTYVDANDGYNYSDFISSVNRSNIYIQAVYQNYASHGYGQPYHRFQYNSGVIYSSSSIILAY